MKKSLHIVKIGGKLIEDPTLISKFLGHFSELEGLKILVHGGGDTASRFEAKLGLIPKVVEGRRITDSSSLEVVTMVYGGLINKNIVSGLQGLGCNALGLCGADGNIVRARKRPVTNTDFGYAGDLDSINTNLINQLLQIELVPVVCPLTHDGNGQLLNTNADTIASGLAVALSKFYDVKLLYCFDKRGVLLNADDDNSVISNLNKKLYAGLIDDQTISEGMLPKLTNAFQALEAGVSMIKIGNAEMLADPENIHTSITL